MPTTLSRRAFLKLTGLVGGAFLLTSCKIAEFTQGASKTGLPQIEGAWTYSEGALRLDLTKLPELAALGRAVRIEGDILPYPILVVLGEDGKYYAFRNTCTHAGRMLDPVTGTMTLRCTSVTCRNPSTFDYQGNVLSGLAEKRLTRCRLSVAGNQLTIAL